MSNLAQLTISKNIATVTLNRPEKRNSITPEMMTELDVIFGSLETNDVVRFGDVIADFGRFEIRHKDEVHTMTTREQELLRYFLENDGVVLSRARLQSDVWKDSADISSRSVDNFVMRLRRMIESDPSSPRHLLSIR